MRGWVVASVTGESSPVGLRKDDVVIDYNSVYDLVMGQFAHFGGQQKFKGLARYGGKLFVLRSDQRLILTVKKSIEQK